MADLLNEQEQVDAIKRWWKQYGNWLMTVIIIILLGLWGYRFWQNHEQKVAMVTAAGYEQLLVDIQQNNLPDMQAQANQLMSSYPHSIYASLAALILAQTQVQQNQLSQAATTLQWVMQNGRDDSTITIAKIRLGRILLAESQPQQALDTLMGIEHHPLADMVRGDAYVALKQYTPAKKAYQTALGELAVSDPMYQLVQMKGANLPQ